MFRELALDLFVQHLRDTAAGCTCDACEKAEKAFNTREDRIEIQLRLLKEEPEG